MLIELSLDQRLALAEVLRGMMYLDIRSRYKNTVALNNCTYITEEHARRVADWMVGQTKNLTQSVRFSFSGSLAGKVGMILSNMLHSKGSNHLFVLSKSGIPMPNYATGGRYDVGIAMPGICPAEVLMGKCNHSTLSVDDALLRVILDDEVIDTMQLAAHA